MITLAILNQKGGTGKTTTAVTIAAGLARMKRRVLLVDLDAQGNVADSLRLAKGPGLLDLLVNRAGLDAVQASGRNNLDLVLSDKSTMVVKQFLARRDEGKELLRLALVGLGNMAADVGRGYDYFILDSAPGADVLQLGAMVACDYFLIPVALDHLAVVGAADVLATFTSLHKDSQPVGDFLGVLPTMWERSTRESHEQLLILVEQFERWVWPPVPKDVKAREAASFGETLWEYAPATRALTGVLVGDAFAGGYERVLAKLLEVT